MKEWAWSPEECQVQEEPLERASCGLELHQWPSWKGRADTFFVLMVGASGFLKSRFLSEFSKLALHMRG